VNKHRGRKEMSEFLRTKLLSSTIKLCGDFPTPVTKRNGYKSAMCNDQLYRDIIQ